MSDELARMYRAVFVDEKNKDDWDYIIMNSIQYNPFMMDEYLSAVGYKSDKYIVYKTEKPYMGLCVPVNMKTDLPSSIVPYAPYQGFLYTKNSDGYTDYHNNVEATEVLLEYLYTSKKYDELTYSNIYTVKDMRAVQWHHYHEPQKGVYEIRMRYSSVLDICNMDKTMCRSRRRELKLCSKYFDNDAAFKSEDKRDFLNLYELTFERQNINLDVEVIEMVSNIIDTVLLNDIGELWYIKSKEGIVTNARVVLRDAHGYGYDIFNASNPEYRKWFGNTKLLYDILHDMKNRGFEKYDFVGVNSPLRGDYKLSFGGKLVPYYLCSIKYSME